MLKHMNPSTAVLPGNGELCLYLYTHTAGCRDIEEGIPIMIIFYDLGDFLLHQNFPVAGGVFS